MTAPDPRVVDINVNLASLVTELEQQKALVAQLWTPRALPNLAAWYDVSNTPSVHLSGSLVDQLDDLSGNGFHAQASLTKPTYSAAAVMGEPGISGGYLQALNFPMGGNVLSVFALASVKRIANARLVSFKANGDAGDFSANSVIPLQMNVPCDLMSYKAANLGSSYTQPVTGGTHGGVTQTNQPLMDDVFLRMGTVFDGAQNTLYVDNIASDPVACTSAFGASGTLTLLAGNGGNLPWGGVLGEVIIVKGVPSDDDRERINTWLSRHWERMFFPEGDSIPHAGPGSGGYTYTCLPNLTKPTFLANIALGGSTLNSTSTVSALAYRKPFWSDVRIPKNKNGKEYVLFVAVSNGLGFGGLTAYLEAFGAYTLAAKAAGYDKVVVGTVLSRTDYPASHDANFRNPFNATLRTQWAADHGIDAIADFASDPLIGVDQAPAVYPALFNDQVHPSPAGFALMEPYIADALNSL